MDKTEVANLIEDEITKTMRYSISAIVRAPGQRAGILTPSPAAVVKISPGGSYYWLSR